MCRSLGLPSSERCQPSEVISATSVSHHVSTPETLVPGRAAGLRRNLRGKLGSSTGRHSRISPLLSWEAALDCRVCKRRSTTCSRKLETYSVIKIADGYAFLRGC